MDIFYLVQPYLVLLCLLRGVLGAEVEERSGQCCWRGQGRGSSEDPPSLLCHSSGLPGALGCWTPEAAWKLDGILVPICFNLVYSVLPGALLNGIIVHLCSLFTSFNVTAVHATQGKPVHVLRLWVKSQPCFFFFFFLHNF